MADVQFGSSAHKRPAYDTPVQPLVNWFAETAPSQPDRRFNLLPTPGMSSYATLGSSGSCTGVYRREGLLSGQVFVVCNKTLFKVDSTPSVASVGSLGSATGMARFASVRGWLAVLQGDSSDVYVYDDSTLSKVTDSDVGSSVKDIAGINGRILFITGDDQFVWSEVLDPDNVDALSFATAERSPDDLKAILIQNQEVWLMGGSTIEVWTNTGGVDAFAPLGGAVLERGLLTRNAACVEDNTIWWVGEDFLVYRAQQYTPQRVSTHYIEEKLRGVSASDRSDIVMFSYSQDGHKFIVLRTPNDGTFVFDIATGQWHERETRGRSAYRAVGAVWRSNDIIVADGADNKLYTVEPETFKDGDALIVRTASAYTPVRARTPAFAFAVDCTKGAGDATTTDPQMMLRYSDDQGRTWVTKSTRSMGKVGEYSKRVLWRQLGSMRSPGRIWEISVSEPVQVAIYGARLNDIDP